MLNPPESPTAELPHFGIVGEAADGPIVAAAIHAGHAVRGEVERALALNPEERRREEDPYTEVWTAVANNAVVVKRSRFEVDCNRPRESAVYRKPEDAWGLKVWREPPSDDLVARSLEVYDRFYAAIEQHLRGVEARHGKFVLLDLHSYNHRRGGPEAEPADPVANPEVNVGTGNLNRERWGPLVDRFMEDLRTHDLGGHRLDVRENVRFRGGYLSRFLHERFPETGCVLAVEVKKFFMDEWTGEPFPKVIAAIGHALQSTVPGLRRALEEV